MTQHEQRLLYIKYRDRILRSKKSQYDQRKAMHVCVACGSPKLSPTSKTLCQFHVDMRREHCRNFRRRLKEIST